MSTPLEIIVGPMAIYTAPVGEAFPAVDATPSGNWVTLGTSGKRNYSEDGVTVTHTQENQEIYVVGSTGAVKVVRVRESLMVDVTVFDLAVAEYTKAIANVTPTTTAPGSGTIGTKEINLRRGPVNAEFALLIRGEGTDGEAGSPEFASSPVQYQVPRVYVEGEPQIVYAKGGAAGLAFQFKALEDSTASTAAERFGKYIYKHADALP